MQANRRFVARRILVLFAVLAVIAFLLFANRSSVRDVLDSLAGSDYSGTGSGSVVLTIEPGQDGATVAQEMVDLGIVKTYRTLYKHIVERDFMFHPGSYTMNLKMSSNSALDALANPVNRISNRVTIREGLRIEEVLKELSVATKLELDELSAAAKDLIGLGIPGDEVSAEGWLFPATYQFDPELTPKQILKNMVDRTKTELNRYGVAEKDWHRVLTLASIVENEVNSTADYYKAARVFLNRLDIGMPLQSDATVSYGVRGSTFTTSKADRADANPYNTYKYPGLPIGPIGAPGSLAIDAVVNPAEGDWLYFVTVNLKTGETVFSNTYAEHQKAVKQWLAWMKENPGYD
ncbi:MAG: hypothetical protein RIR24_756 [Actinomycetota bacterium]|jgi:UPF0755 protein